MNKFITYLMILIFISACGGGGGGGSAVTPSPSPTPTTSLTSSVSTVETDTEFTLTWTSTNTTSCTASGDWSNSIATSGSQAITETTSGNKTYTITCTGDGGSDTSSVTVTINPEATATSFNGFAIDGYISGANIFIDQNFNFKQDDGEFTAVTNADGSFTIETNDEAIFACLKKRPIVADVPVGAVDSTLGGVTKAYQMILPSLEDAGTNTIVISPFTSLLAEAIITGKNNSNLKVELTVEEGCTSAGDLVATNITSAIVVLKNSIETNFGISYDDLLGDFLANSTNSKVTEEVAQSIASYFPSLKAISSEVSNELTTKFETPINIDLTLNQSALNSIFSSSAYTELPLNFNTYYRTPLSDDNWFTEELIYTTGAKLTNDGKLKNFRCLGSSSSSCETPEGSLSLNKVADAARNFMRTSFFRNQDLNVYKPFSAFQAGGVLVASNDRRDWYENSNDGTWRRNCTNREDIEINGLGLQVDGPSDKYNEYRIDRSYFAEISVDNLAICDLSNRERQVRISTAVKPIEGGCNGEVYCLNGVYNIGVLSKTRLVASRPINFTDDYKNIDVTGVIDSMVKLPIYLSEIDSIRSILSNAEFYDLKLYEPEKQYFFTMNQAPWLDRLTSNSTTLHGQAARNGIYEIMKASLYYSDSKYSGTSAPKSKTLFWQRQPCLTAIEKAPDGVKSNYYLCSEFDFENETIEFNLVGGAFDLDLVHSILDGDSNSYGYVCNLGDSGTDCPNLSLDVHLDPDDSIDEDVNLKFTLERINNDGNVLDAFGKMQINFDTSFDAGEDGLLISLAAGSLVNFIYTSPDGTTLSTTATNGDIDDIFIPERFNGSSDVNNSIKPDSPPLQLKINKLLNLLDIGETSLVKDYFVDDGRYQLTVDLGGLYMIEREGRRGNKITSQFKLKTSPPLIVGTKSSSGWESATIDLCFNANRQLNSDITFNIVDVTPQGERGNASSSDYSLSSSSVTILANTTSACVDLTLVDDQIIYEGSEFIYFEMQDIVGAEAGLTKFNFEIFDHKSHLDPRN